MNTQLTPTVSNDLRHIIKTKDTDGNTMHIKIRLNDEGKNGHQDFAITASIWEKGKPQIDKYWIMGGCCHEEILKSHPELKIFVDLHLCDYKGIPMHAVANGYYHLRQGFNVTKPSDSKFKAEYCNYYRISPSHFEILNKCESEVQFAIQLKELRILNSWENQALDAIEILEGMANTRFLVDSKKTQYIAPTPEQIADENAKQEAGYYTVIAKEQRQKDAESKLMFDLLEEERKKIEMIREEYAIKGQVLQIGGKAALNNCIYYTHSKELAFNWRGYDEISEELIAKVSAEIRLPDGAKITTKKK